MNGFWVRLRRSKLAQWAAAYVAAAFALIQVLDVVVQRFGWPDRIEKLLILALAVGFFVALVLAWYHGERGAQRVGGTELVILALLLAIGGGVLWVYARAPRAMMGGGFVGVSAPAASASSAASSARTAAVPLAAATAAIPAKSVAVLPFENLSTDKGNAYFADGMQDLILTKLADIGDLKVISRTSTMKYASHPDDLKTVGQQLGVATILEGSVQKAGNQVLINVQLIDAKTDAHVWAESYTRTLDNIFGVEGEVAQKVANALKAKLSPAEAQAIAKAPTHNKAALDAYLRASYYLDDSNRTLEKGELERAAALATQATELDPDFSDAWNLLSLAYVKYADYGDRSRMPQAEAAARRALALNPNDARAHMDLGFVLGFKGDAAGAIAHAREAVRLRPSDPVVLGGLGVVYANTGDPSDAAVAFQRAIQLKPKGKSGHSLTDVNLADAYMMLHRYVEARDVLQAANVRDPADVMVATTLAQAWHLGWGDLAATHEVLQGVPAPVASSGALSDAWYWQKIYARDYAAALDVIGKAPAAWFTQRRNPRELYQAHAYQAQGDAAKAHSAFAAARAQLEAWIKSNPNDADLHARLALTLAGLGENAQALHEAQRAVGQSFAKDAFDGPRHQLTLAQVDLRTGNTGVAITLLDHLLSIPAGDIISVPMLKLDPTWDPIRHDPRFQALLKK